MTKYLLFALFASLSVYAGESLLDHKIHELMEEMDLPESGAKKLARKGDFTNKGFAQAIDELTEASRKFAELKHPDEKFRQMSQDSLELLQKMQKMLKKGENLPREKVKIQWRLIVRSCKACHKAYSDH